jgi:hypothetical protein
MRSAAGRDPGCKQRGPAQGGIPIANQVATKASPEHTMHPVSRTPRLAIFRSLSDQQAR